MKQNRTSYVLPDGQAISYEQVKAMSDEEFWATIPPEAQNFFEKQPELLKSYRLQAEGEKDASREAVQEAVHKILLTPKDFVIVGSSLKELQEQLESKRAAGLSKELFDELSAKLPDILKEVSSRREQKREPKAEFVPNTPEEQADVERFAEKGFNLFLSKENFETLLTMMNDSHHMYTELLDKGGVVQTLMSDNETVKEGMAQTEERHHNWHTLHEEVHTQFAKLYPALAEGADDRSEGETLH